MTKPAASNVTRSRMPLRSNAVAASSPHIVNDQLDCVIVCVRTFAHSDRAQ